MLALSWLAACGGGGGDDAGATETVAGLTLNISSPQTITQQVDEGGKVNDVTFTGTMSGDLSKLNGKNLYLLAVLPDKQFFEETPRVSVLSSGYGTVTLVGRTGFEAPAGVYSDTITIRACLDIDCRSEIKTTGGRVPYTLTVKPYMKVTPPTVNLSAAFGATVPTTTLDLVLPPTTESWSVAAQLENDEVVFAKGSGPTPTVDVTMAPQMPGTLEQTLFISAKLSSGDRQSRMVTVRLETTASSAAYAVETARFLCGINSRSQSSGVCRSTSFDLLLPQRNADRVVLVGVGGLTHPAAAAGIAHVVNGNWLKVSTAGGYYSLSPQRFRPTLDVVPCPATLPTCIPGGRYTATVTYRYTPPTGAPIDIQQPVILDHMP